MQRNTLGQPVGDAVDGWAGAKSPPRSNVEGRFCRVEPLKVARHAEDLIRAFAEDTQGRLWTYMPVGPFRLQSEMRSWLAQIALSEDPLYYAILDSAGKAVGLASYCRIRPEFGVIEVGYIVYSPRLQRTPAATEAMYLMMKRAFAELGYRRYEWKCDSLNAASRQAAERLGFSFDGIFRQALVYKNRNRDTAWYSILDHEWPVIERGFQRWLDPANFDEHERQRARLSDLIYAERNKPEAVTND